MPLRDHFHPPLYPERNWASMHSAWANALMARLNESLLPPRYFAETELSIGGRVVIDVGTAERVADRQTAGGQGNGTAVAVAASPETYAPPEPGLVIPAVFPDEIEVQIRGGLNGAELVAAIELVSPSNKDRDDSRRAFAAKCCAHLQIGVGVVVVDVVTARLANMHNELMALLHHPPALFLPAATGVYAVAYRPVRRGDRAEIDCWPFALAVGRALPTVPLALRDGPILPLDLELTYEEAIRRSRL